jgi:hypothetical protein
MVQIHSTTANIATVEVSPPRAWAACGLIAVNPEPFALNLDVMNQSALMFDVGPRQTGAGFISVRHLPPDVMTALHRCPEAGRLLQSILRVTVVAATAPEGEQLPDVCGRHQLFESGIRFTPHLPFEPGVRFRATFDARPLGSPQMSEVLTREFSRPSAASTVRTKVSYVFPSGHLLPENLLRFYVCFSNPMQRGRAEEQIALLGPDGRPAPDTLYRPPVELWDRSMRCLTILLDPGRLKRSVGPNRELGPPLKAGRQYSLAIGSGMVDFSGRTLQKGFHKSFHVTSAVRGSIAVERWTILPPPTKSRQPVVLVFPTPLDWALLWHTITVASEGGEPMDGRIAIDRGETRWSFTPRFPWTAGAYSVRVASQLEDVCGNGLVDAFDRPLRSAGDAVRGIASRSMSFYLA